MGLLDSISNLFKKDLTNFGFFEKIGNSSAPNRNLQGFLKANKGWVYSAVSAIADDFSDIDLHLYMKVSKGKVDVTDEELAPMNVLDNPNRVMTKRDLLWLHSAYLELNGQSFWYTPLNSQGAPSMIIPLLPHRVSIVTSKTSIIGGYVYTNDQGTRIPLDFEEVKYFRKPDPESPLTGGLGTAAAADVSIDTWYYASRWNKDFFYNSAIPQAVLKTPKRLTEEQYERIRDEWNEKHAGLGKSHKVGLLESGLEYQQIATSPKDMDFRGLKQETRDEILGVFRVPKTVVGVTDDVNRANAEATDYVFGKRVIKPRMARFVDALNKYWIPSFNMSGKYSFGYTDPTPQDRKLELETYAVGINSGQITPNEAREELDRPAIQGGDSAYMPANLLPIGEEIAGDGQGKKTAQKAVTMVKYAKENKPKSKTSED